MRTSVFALFLALGAQPAAAANDVADKAVATTQTLLAGYRQCGSVPLTTPCPALDDLFDFAALTQAPLAGHVSKLTPGQKKRLQAAFGRVVRAAARQSGRELGSSGAEVRYVGQVAKGAKTDVHVVRAEDDVDAHVAFIWRTSGARWQIVDVEIDGASMVQDYHNQFGRVLKKDGPEGLVTKVESRANAASSKDP